MAQNIRKSIKKFEQPQVVHRQWNGVGGIAFTVYKKTDDLFIHTAHDRDGTEKIYRYFSNNGIDTYGKVSCSLEITSSVVGISEDYTTYTGSIFQGFIDSNDYIYTIAVNSSGQYSGVDRGYIIFKSKDTGSYNEFISTAVVPLATGAMDNAPNLVSYDNQYFIYGRLRRETDWGTPPAEYTEDQKEIWSDRRGVRIFSSSNIDTGWGQISIDDIGQLDPVKFDPNYITNTIRQDFYSLFVSEIEGVLVGEVDTFFKDENRLPVLRSDRISGTGQEYPTIALSTDGITYIRIQDSTGDTDRTITPNELKRTWETPSGFENSQQVNEVSSSLVSEFGQVGCGPIVSSGSVLLGYFGGRQDTHYRPIDNYSSSYAGREDDLMTEGVSELAGYDSWVNNKAQEIENNRLANLGDPDFEWRRLDSDTELPLASSPDPMQKPTWTYVAKIRKDGLASWQKETGISGSIITRAIEDPTDQLTHIGINASGSFSLDLLDGSNEFTSSLLSQTSFDDLNYIIPLPGGKPNPFKVKINIYDGDLFSLRTYKSSS